MIKELQLNKRATNAISNMILISGPARSGTTILGKLIHTAKEVEYAYEPPLVYTLFPLINEISKSHWKILFETFCYEQLLLGHVAGRNLNFNHYDDSYIFHVKPKEIIEKRLNTAFQKVRLEKEAGKHVFSLKMPDITPFLPKFRAYYPRARILIVIRKANDVLNSTVKKKWFDDITVDSPNIVWPYRVYKNCRIPAWVKIADADRWYKFTNIERAAYAYLSLMEPINRISNAKLINYHDLIAKPNSSVRNLFRQLCLTHTKKTTELISTVAPMEAKRDDLIKALPGSLKRKIIALEKRYLNH